MADLDDYSGEFRPDIRYEDFSKEALGRLIEEYCRLGHRLDGTWQEVIRKRSGVEEATAAEDAVWEHLVPFWQTRVAKALRITGDSVSTYLKLLQMDPQMCYRLMGVECELQDEDHGTFRVKSCHAVKYFKHMTGDMATLERMCILDEVAFQGIAKHVNPEIQVKKVFFPTDPGAPECPNCEFRVWIEREPDAGKRHG
jgi:hypothetical protein